VTLVLHGHPLSSFVQKTTMALYENETPFELRFLDVANADAQAAFRALWPIGKMPVLYDDACDHTVAEASIIIEYVTQHYPGRAELIPKDAELARQVRFRDRFFDLYVAAPMQKIASDRRRPVGKNDPYGVDEARALLKTALDMIEEEIKGRTFATGESFTMADCAAAPSLSYANWVMPFAQTHPEVFTYLERLRQRPSFVRVLKDAAPYKTMYPKG
jgi:glutathione S-transferase